MKTLLAIAMIIAMAVRSDAGSIKRIDGNRKPLRLAKPYGYKAPAKAPRTPLTAETVDARRAFLQAQVTETCKAWMAARKKLATFEAHVSIMNDE